MMQGASRQEHEELAWASRSENALARSAEHQVSCSPKKANRWRPRSNRCSAARRPTAALSTITRGRRDGGNIELKLTTGSSEASAASCCSFVMAKRINPSAPQSRRLSRVTGMLKDMGLIESAQSACRRA